MSMDLQAIKLLAAKLDTELHGVIGKLEEIGVELTPNVELLARMGGCACVSIIEVLNVLDEAYGALLADEPSITNIDRSEMDAWHRRWGTDRPESRN